MPIYEFDCEDCGHRFEKLVRRPGETIACPACASGRARKRFSVFAAGGGRKEAPPAPA